MLDVAILAACVGAVAVAAGRRMPPTRARGIGLVWAVSALVGAVSVHGALQGTVVWAFSISAAAVVSVLVLASDATRADRVAIGALVSCALALLGSGFA